MTEASKEAVEAFEKAMNLAFEYHYDPPYNAPISECVKVAMEMLGDSGFTIAPIAPVTDEKLRAAYDILSRLIGDFAGPKNRDNWRLIESALSELAIYRSNDKSCVYANRSKEED